MLFSQFQKKAKKTAKYISKLKKDLEISTTQLAYETGSVLDAYLLFKDSYNKEPLYDHLKEELGDVLWYLANIARIFKLSLDEIVVENAARSGDKYLSHYPSSQKPQYVTSRIKNISYFQSYVRRTDIRKNIIISVLGLIGEVGSIATITKKVWRDSNGNPKKPHIIKYQAEMKSEIGDCLWYLASISENLNLPLEIIARENLTRTQARWLMNNYPAIRRKYLPDDSRYPLEQRFPKSIPIKFVSEGNVVLLRYGDINIGDRLTDNAYEQDYYRYHDVFHLAYMAILKWSPVMRDILKCKRKKNIKVDEVQDGARAAIIEETVANYVYQQSKHHDDFKKAKGHIDAKTLDNVRRMTSTLEIKDCPAALWEHAIFQGFKIFHLLKKNKGGLVTVDVKHGLLKYSRPKSRNKRGFPRPPA